MINLSESWAPASRIADLRAASLRPALSPAPPGSVSLAMGEPDFDTPVEIIEAAQRAMREGHTHYADQQGLPELRSALAARLPGDVQWSSDDVLVTHGATAALAAVILATIGPGDRVVIPEPGYSLYADLVGLAGGTVDHVPLDPSLHWDLERLASALTDAAMIVFSNPSNPCGVVHTNQELRALARLLEGTPTLVVADEAYHRIVYPGYRFRSALDIPELRDRTVYVQTFSKTYAMTGWRVGYLAGPSPVVSAAAQVHRTLNGSVNTANQMAAVRALELDDSATEPMLQAYRTRREVVVDVLEGATNMTLIPPEGAFYGLLRYDIDLPATRVVEDLKAHGVVVRAGSEYGPTGEGHVRISFAVSEDHLRLGLDRMKAYFADSRESAAARARS